MNGTIYRNNVNYGVNISDSQPVGQIIDSASDSVPAGYLPCDGRSLLRSDYPDLFKKIGTKYGAEDDEHFNLPTEEDTKDSWFSEQQWATINSGLTQASIPTKVSQLTNDSGFSSLKSVTKNYGTITIPSNCYYEVNTGVPDNKQILFGVVPSWSTNSGCFSVIAYSQNRAYIVGNSGVTITGLSVRWYYI